MAEIHCDESQQRVHPGYCTGAQQRQQKNVNNGQRRQSGDLVSHRGNKLTVGEAQQTTFSTKEDVIAAKMSGGGEKIVDSCPEHFMSRRSFPFLRLRNRRDLSNSRMVELEKY